jgi:2-hydroxy-6-oxonona-2,4-dienedioate hydrolase
MEAELMQTTTDYLTLADGTMYYEVSGSGDPLVLSHAAFLDSGMFDVIMAQLSQHWRVVRYDMRGFGRSGTVQAPVCRRMDVYQLLQHLGINRAHMVGCSNGGQIMLDIALEHPERVASLTLVGTTPSGFDVENGSPPRYLFEMFAALQAGDTALASELQIRIFLDGEGREPDQIDPILRAHALSMNRIAVERNTFAIADMNPLNPLDPPALGRLGEVQCPTLVMVGAFDHASIQQAAHEMTMRIPNARYVLFQNSGHVPSFEEPETFVTQLSQFLRK